MKHRKKRRDIVTFSKKWVSRLMCASIIWISLSYVLAFMGMTDIAESLSSTVVTGVIFVMLPYFAKSLFETKWEKDLEFKREQFNSVNKVDASDDSDDSSAVG
nr:MAG TPA: hypothetical protein [Caudoviricetes sp.]